ncbi:MAG: methyl-accepting chemotaxis protein, partial [Stenotrophomonas sp.]
MAEISAASQEQSAGIDQVNQTVMQMDETTQQNAALVEEATAAARSMEDQANQLTEAVAVFRTAVDSGNKSANKAPVAVVTQHPQHRPRPVAVSNRSGQAARKLDEANWQEF